MYYPRIIARLDIKGPNLVKGLHLEGLRVLGDPAIYAKKYFDDGVDELFYQDVVASLYGRNSIYEFIKNTANNISIPLTVGGGIRSINDIANVLEAGADKVSINTAAINNPKLIEEASRIFGSSTIVISVETIKSDNGNYLAYTDNGREFTGVNIENWCPKVQDLGAGEIVLTSIDNEGTGKGFDLEILSKIRNKLSIPIVAHGGFGNSDHIINAFESGANAVALASMIHYGLLPTLKNHIKLKDEGNSFFFENFRTFNSFDNLSIIEIKKNINKKIKLRL